MAARSSASLFFPQDLLFLAPKSESIFPASPPSYHKFIPRKGSSLSANLHNFIIMAFRMHKFLWKYLYNLFLPMIVSTERWVQYSTLKCKASFYYINENMRPERWPKPLVFKPGLTNHFLPRIIGCHGEARWEVLFGFFWASLWSVIILLTHHYNYNELSLTPQSRFLYMTSLRQQHLEADTGFWL